MQKRRIIFFIGDILIVTIAFLVVAWLKPATKRLVIPSYTEAFLIFMGIWVVVSLITKKYGFEEKKNLPQSIRSILVSNFVILAAVTVLMAAVHFREYSRFVVFGTYILSTLLELMGTMLYLYNWKITVQADYTEKKLEDLKRIPVEDIDLGDSDKLKKEIKLYPDDFPYAEVNRNVVIKEAGEKVYNYISGYFDIAHTDYAIFSTTTRFNIEKQPDNYYKTIVNLKKLNDILRINKFLELVNSKLPKDGIFIGCVESKNLRKKRMFRKTPPVIREIHYFFDFIFKRVFPKVLVLKQIYFFFNQGKNRVVSKQETFGRLYSCGFEHVHDIVINGMLYFVFKKVKEPAFDYNPSYGPLFKMRRIGKNGKIIYVYKMRTMYPYSEYLQEYIYNRNKLDEGGKFKRDFRITTAGRIMRKFWIDELPMLLNLLTGDMKLVGVRPLSKHYLSLYTEEFRAKRMKYKPGLIPPFYVDMPKTLDEIMESENKYLTLYEKRPFRTDVKYFFAALSNIIFRKARSK